MDKTEELSCLSYLPGWVVDADRVFEELTEVIEWEQHDITMFGRTVPTPRLTAWMGDEPYTYSGLVNEPKPWPAALQQLRLRLEAECGTPFNSCLANLYRGGSDSMGYHSDDEPELGSQPTIASVSLGARRNFVFRHRVTKERWAFNLGTGDLLIMKDESQADYAHAIPKSRKAIGPRINLTFRYFRSRGGAKRRVEMLDKDRTDHEWRTA